MPSPGTTRNIVLLSDGTGNSSAKLMKTNVWRMYEALQLVSADQIALYDNGVGTSSFAPFAMLGGAMGFGLAQNVRNLYTFACINYRPGDRIFAFGFSRGAFTIRVLIGMIQDQGLITGVKGRELQRRVNWAYREYRRRFNPTKGLVTPLRGVRDWALRTWERKPAYDPAANLRPTVAFVGLWDTVDAYGLPIDEMTRGWDRYVWPLTMSDRSHPDVVEKLCHAVSLDDERHTFHPVLLDESQEPICAHIDQERLTQVWFAGAHSNVGGGYPDDSIAYVPLLWIADQACKKGLRLHEHARKDWISRADPNGPISDSRHGIGSYYRYNPRSIQKLTDDRFAKVQVPRPKIHESVLHRIDAARDGYAPIVMPDRYAIVRGDGAVIDPPEHPTQSQHRCAEQERIWNLVWWRRIAYFATVFLTAALFARPFILDANAGGVLAVPSTALSGAIGLLSTFLPNAAQPWVEFYQNRPWQLIVLAGLVLTLLWVSGELQGAINDRMRALWDAIGAQPGAKVTPGKPPNDWVYRLRSRRAYRSLFESITQKAFPFVFGMGCLAAIGLVILGTVNRTVFALASARGGTCIDTVPARAWEGQPTTVSLQSRELCQQTGLELRQGQPYRVEIVLPDNDTLPRERQWRNGEVRVDNPSGFSSGEYPLFILYLPFRRVLTARWFMPMVRIGNHVAEYHRLDQIEEIPEQDHHELRRLAGGKRKVRGFAEFTPVRTGQMFLFVNDAVLPGPWVKRQYQSNNYGQADVTVFAVDPDPAAATTKPR